MNNVYADLYGKLRNKKNGENKRLHDKANRRTMPAVLVRIQTIFSSYYL